MNYNLKEKDLIRGTVSFYKSIIDSSPAGYAYHKIIVDEKGIFCDYEFLEVNLAFEKFTGLMRSEIKGKKFTEVFPGSKKDSFDCIKYYEEVTLSGGEKEFEQYSKHLNKWFRVLLFSPEKEHFVTLFVDISHEKSQLEEINSARDITEHKLLESTLRSNEEKYRQITENISDMVWVADLNLKASYVSPSVKNILGDSILGYLGRTIEEKYTKESLSKLREVLLDELEKEKDPKINKFRTRLLDVEQYRADGSTIWVNMHVSFIRNKNGEAIGY